MKRVAIYMRVSTDKQAREGDSISAQRDALTKYIKEHGYILVGEYLDDGISGAKEDRKELQKMLTDVKAGKIDLILVTKMDRLHRSLRNFLNMQDILDKYHCDWLAIWEPIYDTSTPQGRMVINTMMNLAQFEAEQTGQRIRQVFDYKQKVGEVISGHHPWGFKIENKRLVHDENAETVVKIFKYYDNCGNLRQTTRYAQSIGYPSDHVALRRLLTQKKYIGAFRDNPQYCEPIVSRELFDSVQRKLGMNIKRSQKRTYIFSGLLVCRECGAKMIPAIKAQTLKSGKRVVYPRYRCQKHYDRVKIMCDNTKDIGENVLEKYLLENIKELAEYRVSEIEVAQAKPRQAKKDIAVIERKMARLKELYVNDLITLDEYKADKEKFMAEVALLQKEAAPAITDTRELQKLINLDLKTVYSGMSSDQKRQFWRAIIKEIRVGSDKTVTVEFL